MSERQIFLQHNNKPNLLDCEDGDLPGLTTAHIFPPSDNNREAQLEIYDGGSLATIRQARSEHCLPVKRKGGGIRGVITGFSPASRLRIMRALAKLNPANPVCVAHLTYPGVFPTDPEEYKRHLKLFAQRLTRRFPKSLFYWVLEFQKRGAPHYHLVVFGISSVKFRIFASRVWYEIVNSEEHNHIVNGVRVERPRSFRAVIGYMGKIASKKNHVFPQNIGRVWGCYGAKQNLFRYMAKLITIKITEKQRYLLLRYFRKFAGIKARNYPTLTVFLDGAFWISKLDKLLDLVEEHRKGVVRSAIFIK